MDLSLSEIITLQKGKKPKKQSTECLDGYMPYVDIKAFEQGKFDSYTDGDGCSFCEDGDILIVCDGSRSGLVGKAKKGAIGSTLAKISFSSEIDMRFMFYFIQEHYIELNTNMKGTGTPHVNPTLLGSFRFPILSLAEQRRIVAKIDALFSELDKGVEMLQTIRQQLRTYRQAVLKWAFDVSNAVPKYPVHKLCSHIVDCPHSTPKWTESGKLCLRTTNFRKGHLDLSEKNYVSDETFDERIQRLKPQEGDVLYSREGAILGLACLVPENVELCLGQRMMLLRTNSQVLPRFLMHYLNSPTIDVIVKKKTGGTASPHVNVGEIKLFQIPVPSVDEQAAIVAAIESRLSVCDKLEQIVDESLAKAAALRQSILKKAFAGQLVPQDPNDEPAEKLLERIRAEQKHTTKSRTKGGRKNG